MTVFPIRYKILLMISALLLLAMGIYLAVAARIFQLDKTELVYDLNRSLASTLAAELKTSFMSTINQMKVGIILHEKDRAAMRDLFADDPHLLRVSMYKMDPKTQDFEIYEKYESKEAPDSTAAKIPFDAIRASGLWIWSSELQDSLNIGLVITDGTQERIVVSQVQKGPIVASFKASPLNKVAMVDAQGTVLIHTESVGTSMAWLAKSPLLKSMWGVEQASQGVTAFRKENTELLGGYARVGLGAIGVVTYVEKKQAFLAASNLLEQSLLYGLLILTCTFLASIFFSKSLTNPLQQLMAATSRVAAGDLSTEIVPMSNDETALLAVSFNNMMGELKTSRQQIEEQNRTLELKVEERTKQLEEQNVAIKEAQEALLRTTRLAAAGEIAGRTAHEVLNPLTNIIVRLENMHGSLSQKVNQELEVLKSIAKGWTADLQNGGVEGLLRSLSQPSQIYPGQLLVHEDLANLTTVAQKMESQDSSFRESVTFLLKEAARISRILNSMRSLSAVTSSRRQIGLHSVLHDTVLTMADILKKNGIRIVEKFEAAQDAIFADREEMIQIFSNLLRNSMQSIQQVPGCSGRIEITTSYSQHNNQITVDIRDNGLGMDENVQKQLFQNQFTTKSPDEGTGLGLSICRRLLRAFGGDVMLKESQPGEGSLFRVWLPLHAAKGERVSKDLVA